MGSNLPDTRGYGKEPVPSKPPVAHFTHSDHADHAIFDSGRTTKLRKLLTYTGSKDRLLPQLNKLVNYASEHYDLDHYKEFCGGSGALLLNHEFPFKKCWYNEWNKGVYSLMLALSDVRYVHSVIDKLKLSGVSERVFNQAKKALDSDENLTLVERAVYTYISVMQSFGGLRDSFNTDLRKPKKEAKYRRQMQELYSFHPFLSRVKITNEDALRLLKDTLYDSSSLLFLDPPYHPHAGMTGNNHYGADSWTVEQHQELVGLLIRTRSKVILSGYDNEDYQKLIKSGWRKIFFGSLRVSISSKGKVGDEYVWINFDTDGEGHQF
jgi:site-specific DNA-adenine methylase